MHAICDSPEYKKQQKEKKQFIGDDEYQKKHDKEQAMMRQTEQRMEKLRLDRAAEEEKKKQQEQSSSQGKDIEGMVNKLGSAGKIKKWCTQHGIDTSKCTEKKDLIETAVHAVNAKPDLEKELPQNWVNTKTI